MRSRNLWTRATTGCLVALAVCGFVVRSRAVSLTHGTASSTVPQDPSGDAAAFEVQEVYGRLVHPLGHGIAGVVLELSCQEVLPDRSGGFPEMRSLDVPQPEPTDSAGRFAFTLDGSVPTRVDLRALGEGLEVVEWTWRTDFRGPSVDLGEIPVHAGCALEARVEDVDGHPLIEGWTVHLETIRNEPLPVLRTEPQRSLEVDPESGAARFEGLPPGRVMVWGAGPGGTRTAFQYTVVGPGDPPSLRLTELAVPVGDPLRIALYTEGLMGVGPRMGTVFALDARGERHAMRWDGRSAWTLRPAPEPPYEVVVVDPGFAPMRLPGVWPGVPGHGILQGRSSVQLDVLDPDGQPARNVRLVLLLDRGIGTRVERNGYFRHLELDALEDGWIRGLAPGELEIELSSPIRAPHRLRVSLGPGETRTRTVQLGFAGSLEGRVVDPAGRPVPRAVVEVEAYARVVDLDRDDVGPDGEARADEVPPLRSDGTLGRFVRADDEGRFRVPQLGPGTHRLRVVRSRWVSAETTAVVRSGEATEVTLVAPEAGELLVSPRLPEELDARHLEVELRPLGEPADSVGIQDPALRNDRLYRPTGSWRIREQRAGPTELWIRASAGGSRALVHHEVVHVEAGELREVSPDLTGIGFAPGEIEVWIDGRPASGVVVSLDPLSVPGDRREDRYRVYGGWQGPKLLRGVPMGRYRVLVEGSPGGWTWADPEPLEVVADTPFERRVDVPLVECRLRFVTPDGAAVGPGWIVHGGTVDVRDRHTLATDAEGRAVLRLTPGEQWFLPEVHLPGEVVVTDERLRAGARIVVPESDRPVEFEVVLPAPE